MIDTLKPLIKQFMPFAQERMGFQKPPRLFLRKDENNAKNPLGKTAFYDPEQMSVTLYISGRHPKDIMRSLSHELVHHTQNCNGMFDNVGEMGEGYAQNDEHLREMEREAYEQGNLCFRDWEDGIKNTIYFEHLQKGVKKKMSTKKWKNKELNTLLTEQWGFSMDLSKLSEAEKPDYIDLDGDGDKEESMKKAAADKKAGKKDSEDDKESKNEGMHDPGKRDEKCPECKNKKADCKCPDKKVDEAHCGKRDDDEEELDEVAASSGRKSPHADRRGDDERKRPMQEAILRERIRKLLKKVNFNK